MRSPLRGPGKSHAFCPARAGGGRLAMSAESAAGYAPRATFRWWTI
jgi:hypothetical protein